MKAAIYARKSTDDNDKNEENKSVTRQIDRAKAYAKAKGWDVDEEHIFTDDGISGAEYERRPGLVRMMARLKEFDVIVTSENSRIGRDMVRNAVVIDDIRTKGVRLFYYLNDAEEKFETPEQRLMATLGGFASEMERAKIAERTRDALLRKAEKGYSAGGRCYGYDTECMYSTAANGERTPSHSEYKINKTEEGIVLGIFQMYADGHGHTAIAKTLNGDPSASQKRRVHRYAVLSEKYFDGITPPSPEGGTGSWAPSTIRAMLYRLRYAGKVQYGEYRNVRNGGRVGKCVKQAKFLIVDREDLRIVPPELWDKVQTRLKNVRETYIRENNGTLWGRPETGRESKYLLSGLARCGCKNGEHTCGANIVITGGQKLSHYYYGCGYHQKRGARACTNDTRERMAVMDELVLNEIETKLLDDSAREYIIERAVAGFEAALKQAPQELPKLEAELRKVRKELARFLSAIAGGNAPKSIMAEIARRERRIEQLDREIGRYSVPDVSELDLRRARKGAREAGGRFKDLLRGDVPRARQALRKLLRDRDGNFAPLLFVPVVRGGRKTYNVQGAVQVAPLFNNGGTEERT